MENMEQPGGESHLLPPRPTPATWLPATTVQPWPSGGPSKGAMVEPSTGTWRSGRPRWRVRRWARYGAARNMALSAPGLTGR